MRVFPTHQYGNIELSEVEARLVDLVSGYQEQIAVIAALKTFLNADKVWQVLVLWDKAKRPHASYTLYPIISQIGDCSPEQYVADVDEAVRKFEEEYWRERPELARAVGRKVKG